VPIDLTPLANVGAVGLILAWVLWQMNPRLDRIERAIDMNSRSILLDVVSRDNASDFVKKQAAAMLAQIEARQKMPTSGSSGGT
jgi:hypothetical protein